MLCDRKIAMISGKSLLHKEFYEFIVNSFEADATLEAQETSTQILKW